MSRGKYDVPYNRYPENEGILLTFPNQSAVILYLDFEDSCIELLDVEKVNENQNVYHGYPVDYTISVNYELVEGLINRVGGINLDYNGEKLRYTGSQAVALISQGCDVELRKQFLLKFFEQLSKNDFSRSDLVYIMENSKSDLSIIDCLDWIDHLPKMSKNITFVN